ncbi:putative flagellar protein [Trichinella spiralis]|uniref:Uncharacterized protein n=1 Tax=Trichinella spiralis TaxID=6334 RepID=E5SI83_TRISP|nr:putative flagellar protein [Trichinella spiralis]KRY35903.1 hypothetical protein T01_12886 [Trichinella spiralis]
MTIILHLVTPVCRLHWTSIKKKFFNRISTHIIAHASDLPPNNAIAFWRLWKNESSSSVDQRRHHQQLVIEKRFYHRLQSALSKRDSELQTNPHSTCKKDI